MLASTHKAPWSGGYDICLSRGGGWFDSRGIMKFATGMTDSVRTMLYPRDMTIDYAGTAVCITIIC